MTKQDPTNQQNGTIDISRIAEELVSKLIGESRKMQERAEGVRLLVQAIEQIVRGDGDVGKQAGDSEPQSAPSSAGPQGPAT